jgi:hypothetical protein
MNEPPVLEVSQLTKHFPLRGGLWRRSAGSVKAVDASASRCGRPDLRAWATGRQEHARDAAGQAAEPSGGAIRLDGSDIVD